MEEGDDPNFVSDTNNLITIKQKGPTLREIRDTDMGAAITYLLLDLEGVDTEPDILDDGKKGPWTIFATADCAEQFKAKYGEQIALTFSEIPIEFTITYGEIQTKKGGSSNEQSNARALASALADATTHLVVKINDKSIANRVNTFFLVWGGGAGSTGAVEVKAALAIAAVISLGREGTGDGLGDPFVFFLAVASRFIVYCEYTCPFDRRSIQECQCYGTDSSAAVPWIRNPGTTARTRHYAL